jgi:hypothetical protein
VNREPWTVNRGPRTVARRMRWLAVLLIVLVAIAFASPAPADPSTDYILHCRGCHGPDGSGVPGAAPTFRGQVAKFVRVPGGREYLIRVPGTAQSGLSDARVAALLNWLVREFSPAEVPRDFAPFTSEEVTRHRRPPLTEVERTRRELLRAIRAREAASAPEDNHQAERRTDSR